MLFWFWLPSAFLFFLITSSLPILKRENEMLTTRAIKQFLNVKSDWWNDMLISMSS